MIGRRDTFGSHDQAGFGPNQRSVQGYDRLARHYRLLESMMFGSGLQDCPHGSARSACPTRARVLVLGDGDGRFLERMVQATARVRRLER